MKVNQNHWLCFLEEAEKRPELITGRFFGVAGRATANTLWTDLSTKLNSLGYGQKTTEEWRKVRININGIMIGILFNSS